MRLDLHRRATSVGIVVLIAATILAMALAHLLLSPPPKAHAAPLGQPYCQARPTYCTETAEPWNYAGQYTGHDEPSLLFYSTTPGAGNSNLYQLTLPKDPPTPPADNGSGGTWNFQLHPAFWFGMAMCDDQSAPNPGKACPADSDANIYSSTDPSSPRYFGLTPGEGFMEMQFYPPGFGPVSCDPNSTQWCAALNIDSLGQNANTGQLNNASCLNAAGEEYVNFAIITKSGTSQAPADPLDQTALTFSTTPDTLEMDSGDTLAVNMHDTPAGFQVDINDLTTGVSGSMTASISNGFGHPLFQPNSATCTDQPYAYHPMFSTSSPKTRVLWAAHSYNVAYSDEIGHSEDCTASNRASFGTCTGGSFEDPTGRDSDDSRSCFTSTTVQAVGNPTTTPVPFTLCSLTTAENDFDGPDYQHNWPGSDPNPTTDAAIHAQPVVLTSPLFTGPGHSGLTNYDQVAFETDLPRIEGADTSPNNNCQRHVFNPTDPNPGAGCIDPPNGASFYPFYSTANVGGHCVWEEGDAHLPGTTNTFGGSASAEYGGLLLSPYPVAGPSVSGRYNNFNNTLSTNPCPAPGAHAG